MSALQVAVEALEQIALAGMSGSGQESEEGMRGGPGSSSASRHAHCLRHAPQDPAAKTDREWFEFCRPYVHLNGSHEMPNYAAICRAVLALVQPAPVQPLRELLRRSMGYVKEASTRYYDGTDGSATRASAASLFEKIDAALQPTQGAPATCRMDDGRCGICGGDWSVCGCDGMLRRAAAAREPDDTPLETGEGDAR